MGEKKLDALRKRFGAGTPDEIQTPRLSEAYDVLVTGGSWKKPWQGVPTFLDLPLVEAAPDSAAFAELAFRTEPAPR